MGRLENEVLRADEARARLEGDLLRPVLACVAGALLVLLLVGWFAA